ncbi:phage tail protein [Wolbachia endosymbiont of Pentalonia nigronervosa]|uniref:phage tail protein n=1 Tax=Wolbachia endosymbiont of Pentalonia nigronervosa TaxID=1301914 RepID=UPI00165FCE9B|nr:phage tail protein [Wolbachia endosymbiont of Pentalonia nigronervosa]MBD0392060.1 phage tail protein [Wolbachia endosymbiont of Pentalonia nigronervosa]
MLLPPNATKQERDIVEAIDYKVDPRSIRGFKFNLKDEILPWMIEEYGLEEILLWVKDKKKAIKEGVEFQRLRGTPASLKIALKWANIDDITIIEEPPGKHFFELQIGIQDVPNDFFVDAVIELAKLSLPARSRLMRIFNDLYNAQRFMLDESIFGDLLSDYSGVKVAKEGPVLSFGRKNSFELKIAKPSFKFSTFRVHYERNYSSDLYRLDVAILGETEPHTKNYNGIYERNHLWYNFKALYPTLQSLLPPIKFAKAQVVLSDSWKLGEINGCFPVCYDEEMGDKFLLGENRLSEQLWNFKYTPILERFSVTYHYKIENDINQKVIRFGLAEHNVHFKSDSDSRQKDAIHELESYILVVYPGALTWHEHKHLNRSWNNVQPIC